MLYVSAFAPKIKQIELHKQENQKIKKNGNCGQTIAKWP